MRVTLLCALLVLAPMAATAQTYKCKRPDGRTSFQDQPCDAGATGGPVILQDPSPSYRPPEARNAQAPATKRDRIPGTQPAKGDESLKERNRRLEAENRAMACNAARRNLAVLQAQRPVYHVDKSGKRQYVEDADRQSEIAAAQQSVAESCR